jgi:hypothetical protein
MSEEKAGESHEASTQNPEYSVFQHDPCMHVKASAHATAVFGVQVNEGWRSWILCTNMYKDKADQLLEVLRESGKVWA